MGYKMISALIPSDKAMDGECVPAAPYPRMPVSGPETAGDMPKASRLPKY
jgi:hypothetical protein